MTYSLPLCGILWNERNYHWLYNHFTQIYTLSGHNDSFWIDYLETRDFYQDVVEFSILESESLQNEPNIVGYLEDKISSGYYIVIFLDEYYLPKNENYQKNHFLHQRMVYGYDRIKREFKAIAFDELQNFNILIYDYDEIKDAYEIGRSYYDSSEPWVKKENVELLKPKFADISFNPPAFLHDLDSYLTGNGDHSKIRPMNFQAFGEHINYNFNSYDEFIGHFSIRIGYFRYMHLLAEHKNMMYKRLVFMADHYNLQADMGDFIRQYYQIAKKFFLARNLFLKQMTNEIFYDERSRSREITGKIIEMIKAGRDEEYSVLTGVSDCLK